MKQVYALVDCNNFYASCEKLFRPDLRETPVVVLSNNDGCVVARSKEAKALGIKMGVPVHHITTEIHQYGIEVFSSNYTLYGDMSRRVMVTLESLAPRVDIYSIDEAFLDLTGIDRVVAFEDFGRQIKDIVYQNVGLPVCVGIAPTRTLAKLANYAAKKYRATGGVVDLTDAARQRRLLARVPVEEVWGVGRKLSAKLQALGIVTALQLADTDLATLRKRFSVVLERTARELNGVPCLPWDDAPPPKKQIMCSRSFGQPLQALSDLEEAVSHFANRATGKLRGGRQYAGELMVFVRTNPFRADVPQYSKSASVRLVSATQDSRVIVQQALTQLRSMYRAGYDYAKAGIMLSELVDETGLQRDMFDLSSANDGKGERSARLMAVMDEINRKSRATICMAREAGPAAYVMRREHLSPAYTTNWSQLPEVR
ncbi:DNA polymerase V subunit UmuC [Marinobacter vulgaris]|uniref:DNA polymerase V subunit UmuC n=1 Tax=Marinobacter vulgaris TaxID=1928331 RepID=A0A2V3ZGV8_9GAMM|nr:translesion error-prone DNA polymerase V subunit UmuC [Marinobacter vulgaris]PXX89129.1 DNA polymerase V subunit UmuC [Marinobacter vulgaris]TSJ67427.1 translesion error-prone DNA polymerase V subunit UmuC [Marinobacter vulgaris]